MTATDATLRDAASRELGTWLDASPRRRAPTVSGDGGAWRGASEAAWMTRILRGAPAPRESTGIAQPGIVRRDLPAAPDDAGPPLAPRDGGPGQPATKNAIPAS